MSCSVHDVVRFEKSGLPTAGIGTDGFMDEAEEQARQIPGGERILCTYSTGLWEQTWSVVLRI